MGIKVKLGLVGVVALAGILALLLCAPPVFANGRITPGQSFLTMWTWNPLVIIGTLLVGAWVDRPRAVLSTDLCCYQRRMISIPIFMQGGRAAALG